MSFLEKNKAGNPDTLKEISNGNGNSATEDEEPLLSFIIEDGKSGEKIKASIYGPYVSESKHQDK